MVALHDLHWNPFFFLPDDSYWKNTWLRTMCCLQSKFEPVTTLKVHSHYAVFFAFLFAIWRKCKEWPFSAFDTTSYRRNVAIWRKRRRKRTPIVWMRLNTMFSITFLVKRYSNDTSVCVCVWGGGRVAADRLVLRPLSFSFAPILIPEYHVAIDGIDFTAVLF